MTSEDESGFVIVAVGASAGGLEALERLFTHLPPQTGMAFAVIHDLTPDHTSALPALLAKNTEMPVEEAKDNTEVVADRVYVIPPNTTMKIAGGALVLEPPSEPRGERTPIDSFFTSLARERSEHAVCIMLSGTGTDGTSGLKAIKEYGGMAMAQTLESAGYDSILRSAISTGLVDHVLPVEAMPAKLIEYAAQVTSLNGLRHNIREQLAAHMGRVHRQLKRRLGHDFSQYKEGTIARRVERRMRALQIESPVEYAEALERRPEEAEQLFNDLLIGVTQFFRDEESFEMLQREVIPKLFQAKSPDEQVRACVVGCASGEEAYSIAILLCEHASTLAKPPKIQVFATDIDERSLETARKGRYPENIAEHVSTERLERFFIKQDGCYQVKREVRERCIFSNHSFIKDPPFSRLDLISCRNVMIYVAAHLQQKIIPLFHYALRLGGYLFLGPSENVTSHGGLFRPIDRKHKIFLRRDTVTGPAVEFPLSEVRKARPRADRKYLGDDHPNLFKQIERIILQRFRPASVAVKESGEAVYFSGPIGLYFRQPSGSPESNVLNMAREGLRIPLRGALHSAATSNGPVRVNVPLQNSNVKLSVEPLTEFRDANLFMITIDETAGEIPQAELAAESTALETIRHLESELRTAQEHSQAALDELETTNEELQSTNEEYQSTNEELETSKEELQSFNEELETVNAELNRKIAELDSTNNDLQNLLNSTQIATIFLDMDMRVKNFTTAAGAVFRLIGGDIGRPITDLAARFSDGNFEQDIHQVLRTLEVVERQLSAPADHFYQMRILPYRTLNNVVEGVVITFLDVTPLKKAEQQARHSQLYAESIVEAVRVPLMVLTPDLRVVSANKAFYEMFRVSEHSTAGKPLYELGNGQWDTPELRRLMTQVLPNGPVKNYQFEGIVPDLGKRTMLLNAHQIDAQNEWAGLILVSIDDITESREELLRLNADLKHISYATSHDLHEPLRMVISYTQLLAREYRDKLDPQANQFMGYAIQGAERMEMLLKNLREYWTINEQQREMNSRVNCEVVFDQAVRDLDRVVEESDARITHDRLPMVRTEEVSLSLLLQNLLSNAIKYRRAEEPPQVHMRARPENAFWHFELSDNGIGIDPQYLETIFAPFKRLHGRDVYAGSGLGLAISKKIVERAGGRIWAESSQQCTTFHFTLPKKDGDG